MHRYDYTRKPGATELVPFRTYACKWALAHGRSSRPLISPTTAADNKVAMARKDYQLNALIAGFGHPSRGETEAVTTQNLEVVFSRQSARKIPIMVRLSPSPCVRQSILTPLRGQVIDLTGRRSGNSCASSPIFFPGISTVLLPRTKSLGGLLTSGHPDHAFARICVSGEYGAVSNVLVLREFLIGHGGTGKGPATN